MSKEGTQPRICAGCHWQCPWTWICVHIAQDEFCTANGSPVALRLVPIPPPLLCAACSLLAAVVLAEKLQDTVRVRLGYTLSVGIAHNKLLAKMGSAITKPLGMTVVSSGSFLSSFPANNADSLSSLQLSFVIHLSTAVHVSSALASVRWV